MPTTPKHTPGPWTDGPSNFVRGVTPYHEYKCGCRAAVLGMYRCPTHAAAPRMLTAVRDLLESAERDKACRRHEFDPEGCVYCDARALLAELDGAAPHGGGNG